MHRMFNILDRYLGKEIILTGLAVLLVLLLVVMSAEVAYWLAAVVDGRITADVLLPILSVSLVKYTVVLLPLSMMLTIMLVFGRLYKDSEMAAIMSAGCGPMCWYRPVLFIVVPVTVVMLLMSLYLLPELNAYKQQLLHDASNKQDLASLMAGRFNPARNNKAVFFIESQSTDGQSVKGVFYKERVDGIDTIDVADSAKNVPTPQGDTYLQMQNGQQYIGNAGNKDFRIIKYEEYGIRVPAAPTDTLTRAVRAIPSTKLMNSDLPEYQAELHWRITMPVGMFILAMLAVPLSYTRPRSGRFSKLAAALILYLLYSNLLGISNTWMKDSTIPVWLASWWVHGLAILLLLALLKHYGYLTRAVMLSDER